MVSSTGSAIGSGLINIINTTQTSVRFVVINTLDPHIDYIISIDDPRLLIKKDIEDSDDVGKVILVTGLLPNVSYKLSVSGSTCEAEASFKTKNYSPPTITYITDSEPCISIFASNPDEDPLIDGAVYYIGVASALDPSVVLLPFTAINVSANVCLDEACTTFHIYSYIQYSYDDIKRVMTDVIYQIGPSAIYLFEPAQKV
jgi:hypothetical protein